MIILPSWFNMLITENTISKMSDVMERVTYKMTKVLVAKDVLYSSSLHNAFKPAAMPKITKYYRNTHIIEANESPIKAQVPKLGLIHLNIMK